MSLENTEPINIQKLENIFHRFSGDQEVLLEEVIPGFMDKLQKECGLPDGFRFCFKERLPTRSTLVDCKQVFLQICFQEIARPLGDLPYFDQAQYVSRPEILKNIEDQLQSFDSNPIINICGMGGVGKTLIALEYYWVGKMPYTHKIWWRASSRQELIENYIKLGKLLGYESEEGIVFYIKRFLARHPGWFLVLDGVPIYSAHDKNTYIEDLIPQEGGHVLVTSRQLLKDAANISIYEMPPLEAATIICNISASSKIENREDFSNISPETVSEIAKACAYFPLMLAQIATFMAETPASQMTPENHRVENIQNAVI